MPKFEAASWCLRRNHVWESHTKRETDISMRSRHCYNAPNYSLALLSASVTSRYLPGFGLHVMRSGITRHETLSFFSLSLTAFPQIFAIRLGPIVVFGRWRVVPLPDCECEISTCHCQI